MRLVGHALEAAEKVRKILLVFFNKLSKTSETVRLCPGEAPFGLKHPSPICAGFAKTVKL
jgi:hypothetical protein